MSARDEILARIRASLPAASPLPEVPVFRQSLDRLEESFRENLARMGGEYVSLRETADVEAWVRARFPDASIVCSATPEVEGNNPIERVTDPAGLADVDVGVVRARFGVAETGSVLLTEDHFRINSLGFLVQHLVVLLDPLRIVLNLHDAYRDLAFATARYAVLMTGPSATADIEGVLVRGAQGIRSLTIVAMPEGLTQVKNHPGLPS